METTDITFPSIVHARTLIAPYVRKTPLILCPTLEPSNRRIFLKCEYLQETHSFKVRGAFNALLHLSTEDKRRGVISRSSGNFAQALSYAGHILNIPVTIVMPTSAPLTKKEKTVRFQPRLFFQEGGHASEQQLVEDLAKKEKLTILSPFNHRHVIEGAGTIALEVKEQLPSISKYVCQIGGGGLMAGTSVVLKSLNHSIEILGIEPEGAKDYLLSHHAGHPICLQQPAETICDGLRAPQVGSLAWPLLHKYVDTCACVSDVHIIAAMRFLYAQMGLIIEPSGAASFAALLMESPVQDKEEDIVCILSGGNVDREQFFHWIHENQH